MRFLKWFSLALGAIVALAVIGVLVIVWFVDPNRFKATIENEVLNATGRELRLVGDIELGFFPWLALRTGAGSFGNAPGFGPEPMVSWQGAQLGARLFPLLRGQLVADRVVLDGADVRLMRRADGTANWEGMGGQQPADPKAEPMELRIDGVRIRDSRVRFEDQSTGQSLEVTELNLHTDEIAPGEPFTDTEISGVLHMADFAPTGVPFRLEVPEVVAPKDFGSLQVKEFEAGLADLEVTGAVNGTLGDRPSLQGTLQSNEFDLKSLLASLGVKPPKTSDAGALGQLQFAGSWKFDAGAVAVDPLSLRVDETKFSGHFRRGAGEQAIGEFMLRGDSLALARYLPPTDPNSPPFVLPTAALKALKFRGSLELEQATLNDISMKGVALRLLLDEQGLRGTAAATP